MIRLYWGKILARIRKHLGIAYKSLDEMLIYSYSRNEAHLRRKKIVEKKGSRFVFRIQKNLIKNQAKERFGNSSFWPYLALFAEIRGECAEWIPEDFMWRNLLPIWNPIPQSSVCNLKTLDHVLFGDFVVSPLFLFIQNRYYSKSFQLVSLDEVNNFFKNYNNKIVVKEEFGRGGKEVSFKNSSEFVAQNLLGKKNHVIQPFVEQHDSFQKLYPHSVNTLRVNTFIEEDGSVAVRLVFLRFGANGSRVDNLASGGKYLIVDKNGTPSKCAYDKDGFETGERHDNTGFKFSELEIPQYQVLLDKCIQSHEKFPYVRLIGWDVCITKDGTPKLLEWNADRPHIDTIEGKFGPLFSKKNSFFKNFINEASYP